MGPGPALSHILDKKLDLMLNIDVEHYSHLSGRNSKNHRRFTGVCTQLGTELSTPNSETGEGDGENRPINP